MQGAMSAVHVTIDLENTVDAITAAEGLRAAGAVRRLSVQALVDTGSMMLVLPEDIVEMLGLTRRGRNVDRDTAGPVTVRIGDRHGDFDCFVAPPGTEPLVGQIQLAQMDLVIDPARQTLGVRPESPIYPLLSVK